jgi:hypothetical protein
MGSFKRNSKATATEFLVKGVFSLLEGFADECVRGLFRSKYAFHH